MRLPVRPQLQPGPTAALIAVPAAWGSMFPAIKALGLEAAPPPFALLNFAIHFVGAVALWGLYRSAAAAEPPPPPVAAPEYQPSRRSPAVGRPPVDGQWSMVDGRWSPPSRLAAEAVEGPAGRRRRRGLKSSKLVPRQLVPRRILPVSAAPAAPAAPSLLAVRLPPVPLPPPLPSARPAPARAAATAAAAAAAAQPPLSVAWDELRAVQSAVELGALLSLAQAIVSIAIVSTAIVSTAIVSGAGRVAQPRAGHSK